jgi:PsbP
MKKKAFFGLLVVVMALAVATAGCTSSTNSSSGGSSQPAASTVPAASAVYSNYTNATAGVRLQYPLGWNITEGNGTGSATIFYPPGGGRAYVGLIYNNMPSNKPTLDEYKNDLVVSFTTNGKDMNYTLVSTENTTLGGMPAYNLTFTYTIPSNGPAMKLVMMVTMKDYKGYLLYYGDTSGSFPDYQNEFSNMANSFAITS